MRRPDVLEKEERACAARISYLMLDTFPKILQEFALSAISPKQLNRLYDINRTEIDKSLMLSDEQKEVMSNLSAEQTFQTCDLSLLYKLIRHFKLVRIPTKGWGKEVSNIFNAGDVIEKLRRIRNSIIHRSNAKYGKRKEDRVFYEVLNLARFVDRELSKTTNKFEDEVSELQLWDPESSIREKYILALEKILELEELGIVRVPGYEIAVFMKSDLNLIPPGIGTAEGETNLTVYVKAKGLNNEAVKQRLNEMKDKINRNQFKILFQNAEHGSLILHVVAYHSVLCVKSTMVDEMKSFVERIFSTFDETCVRERTEPAERQLVFKQQIMSVECIFAMSDHKEEGTNERRRQRDEELNEDVKCWKKIRKKTLPRLDDLKTELYKANDQIRLTRAFRNVTTGASLFLGVLSAPFTGGASLAGAALLTGCAAGFSFLIESVIEKRVLNIIQSGVYRDKEVTSRLRQRVTAFRSIESSPFAEELFTVNINTIIGLAETPLLSFIKSWAGIESNSLLHAIHKLDQYMCALEEELKTVEYVQGKHLMY
ncbi:uncharacterized protein LOC127710064 isoform X2 [Mytilus californianus]|uniref:uncharacterized protein LOC127710064 isoform X1 n=2 Tax=Mytilus californianus TaxID=6549 RepID=UPI002247D4C9|nr:uncharacterized protein LOC127710064 isoform X1 [Mytilus californianus]XP_052071753.1 uncharacterized protein LOC127710064 isoform X2 [Mytilus californianus]